MNTKFIPTPYKNILPNIAKNAYIAPNATITGDTTIGELSNIWYNVVIRGDVAPIKIGKATNIQDGSIIHVSRANHAQNKTKNENGYCYAHQKQSPDYRAPPKTNYVGRCNATTKKGTRCKRNASTGSRFCWQH